MKKLISWLLYLASASVWAGAHDPRSIEEAAGQQFLLRAAEYAAYQIESSDDLKNQHLVWQGAENMPSVVRFDSEGRVSAYRKADREVRVSAEVFELTDELFYTSFWLNEPLSALTIVWDRRQGHLFEIVSRRPEKDAGTHRALVELSQYPVANDRAEFEPLARSRKMAGTRLIAHYSDKIAYEHIYLNDHRVTWHGVAGPEAGVADTERYEAYELRKGVFLVSWSEKVLTTHMIFLFDFVQRHEIGTIFGFEPETGNAVLETIGARTEVSQAPAD